MLEDFEIELVCERLALGASLEVAARSIGLVPAEVVGYLEAGRSPMHPCNRLRGKILQAITQSEIKDLQRIENSSDWRAAAWRLARRWPGRWGDKIAVDLAVGVKQDVLNPWTATLKPPDLGPMLGANKNPFLPASPSDETEGSSMVIEAEILED